MKHSGLFRREKHGIMEYIKENDGRSGYKVRNESCKSWMILRWKRYGHWWLQFWELGCGRLLCYLGLSPAGTLSWRGGLMFSARRASGKRRLCHQRQNLPSGGLTPQEARMTLTFLIVWPEIRRTARCTDSIKAVTGPHTTIMSLMNGVDSEDIIASCRGWGASALLPHQSGVSPEADGFHFGLRRPLVGIIFGEKGSCPGRQPRVSRGGPVRRHRAALPGHRLHPGRDVEQVPPQRSQQPAPGHPRRRRRLLP